jgi:copper chaperone NosL
MATYYMSSDIADKPKVNLYVTDFAKPNTLIDARAAVYLQSPNLPSPMAKNLSAFKDRNELEAVKLKYTGTTLTWNDVLAMLARTDG